MGTSSESQGAARVEVSGEARRVPSDNPANLLGEHRRRGVLK
jgi:hypothetical protein